MKTTKATRIRPRIQLSLSPVMLAAATELAKRKGISISALVDQSIERELERSRPTPSALIESSAPAAAAELKRRLAGMDEWPHDAIRHTFATYAVAFTGDAAKVSLWLGHEGNPSLIHRHYRGLATKAQAEAFFALRPL